MPEPCPGEFRDDVVNVARGREPGQTIDRIARQPCYRRRTDITGHKTAEGRLCR
ncbi:hypothetical protein [Kocuria sabuli]|uniref:hypothetical protein n=1 Tax=Kocuria sabuli TaxID=3071448 RepID=UPI0034D498C7